MKIPIQIIKDVEAILVDELHVILKLYELVKSLTERFFNSSFSTNLIVLMHSKLAFVAAFLITVLQ